MHERGSKRRMLGLMVAAMALLAATACGGGDDGDGNGGGSADGDGTVSVALQEWAVAPDPSSVPAGEVTFQISNDGEETHEFVVIATDLGALDLPTAADGSVEEEGGDMVVVDEVEDLPSGESAELTVDLEAGNYILLCNIVEEEDDGEHESHFAMGMRTSFTVE